MNRIKVDHYVDLLIYSIEQVIRGMKSEMNQYINGLDLGITAEQFLVLDTIDSHREDICQQDVAYILAKDKSNIKRLVEILESKGLITRVMGKKNNRLVNYLQVTDDGKKLIKENIEKVKEFMETVFSGVTAEEEQLLKSLVIKLKNKGMTGLKN
ncbi:MAG: MarR family transcriptional regulator [Cyanobacteria bacterium RUI128]|nr:MarR family transcriptional regulator [Cyanobacteria bacterium RUI128]